MPLQLRRGNTAEVNSITPVIGEIVYDTELKRVLVGDGSTAGGIPIAGVSINEAKDASAASLLAGTHQNISFSYNSTTKALSAVVDILTHETIEADSIVTGKIFNSASSVVVDVDTGEFTGNLTGNVSGNVSGDITGVVTGTVGSSLIGNVTGDTTGFHTGDVKGSLFADDSSLIIDAVDNLINISTIVSPVGGLALRPNGTLSLQASVVIGSASQNVNGNLNIVRNQYSAIFDSSLQISNSHESDIIDPVYFKRTRGTPTLYSAVQANDQLGRMSFLGWDGTQFVESSSIRATVDTVSPGIVSSTILISAMDDSGTITTPYRLFPNGRLILGNQIDTSNGSLDIVSQNRILPANDPGQPIVIRQSFDTATANSMGITRSRGTPSAPTALQAGDDIFNIQASGYHGSGYVRSSAITFATNGPVSAGIMPGKIILRTAGLDGVLQSRVEIDETGTLYPLYGIQGDLTGSVFADNSTRIIDGTEGGKITTPSVTLSEFLQLPVYANDAARTASIPSPSQGMVVFMQSGTSPAVTNKTVVFNGSAWESM